MEIHLSEIDDPYTRDPKNWEFIGEKILWTSSIFAAMAAVPAFFKKKRVYNVISTGCARNSPLAVGEAGEVEPNEVNLPQELRCPRQVKDKIIRLFTLIADEDVVTNGRLLWRLGGEIEDQHHVHPLTLLMNMPREKIRQIFNNGNFFYTIVRIPTIMNGVERGMNREGNRLQALIPAFAAQMQKDEETIRRLIGERDWRALVHFLFDIGA